MLIKREHIRFANMLVSVQTDFSFEGAAEACAIFERTSGYSSISETIALRYLKLISP